MVTNLRRKLLISCSIVVGSIIIFTVVLYFLAGSLSSQAKKISVDRGLIDQQTNALAGLASLKQQAPQAAAYTAAINQLLPNQDGLIAFSQWLNTAGAANQVLVNSSFGNVVSPASPGSLGKTNFSFTVNGGLSNIAGFLDDIESSTPGFLLQISSFNIIAMNGGSQLSGSGNVFFRQ